MGIAERKDKARAEREKRIVAAARRVAESEGWTAVTIRRLAQEIEYSQPVLYAHFANRDAIVGAVAIEGFRGLTATLRGVAQAARDRQAALAEGATAYLDFARAHPAVYEAMFTLPSDLRFAEADAPPELQDAFAALAAIVAPANTDREVATETFWAALHGLAELERSGRIRRSASDARLALVVRALLAS